MGNMGEKRKPDEPHHPPTREAHVDPDGPPEIEDAARDEMDIPVDETDEG
jgi:hypothetical protein